MAARKTRRPVSPSDVITDESTAVTESADGPDRETSQAPSVVRKPKFGLAIALFTAWLAALIGLTIWSANPVTLNREQILRAEIVVEADVTEIAAGRCRIIQTWPAGGVGETITIRGLSELSVQLGKSYLIPLRRDGSGDTYSIVTTVPPEAAQIVYPATDDAHRQLSEILGRPK